ncbi:hypothetical protein AB4238_21835 [Shewanella sp. 10N.286.45.A1]|uniref:hypothetical protein n=1 Tax=Shewanella sp. 10N.286.45.A1 TaxID=3229694 RepID=UPI00354BB3FD
MRFLVLIPILFLMSCSLIPEMPKTFDELISNGIKTEVKSTKSMDELKVGIKAYLAQCFHSNDSAVKMNGVTLGGPAPYVHRYLAIEEGYSFYVVLLGRDYDIPQIYIELKEYESGVDVVVYTANPFGSPHGGHISEVALGSVPTGCTIW